MAITLVSGGRASRRAWRGRLAPLPSGPREIRALDGLRALAALSVVAFHVISTSQVQQVTPGLSVSVIWNFLRTGVHLFFVLSGFLLFMPYARAILGGRPLPPARQFYRRRALRILPAYWVCLGVLVLLALPTYLTPSGLLNVGLHALLLHNFDPATDMGIQGVFWTMAVEAQFYVVLPLLALLLARTTGTRGSLPRLLLGIAALALGFVVVRELEGVVAAHFAVLSGHAPGIVTLLLLATHGAQGHYLETFAAGMFCGTLYVAYQDGRLRNLRALRRTGTALLLGGAALWLWLAEGVARPGYHTAIPNACYACVNPLDWTTAAGPLLIGASYGAIVLGVLWGASSVRAVFELAPLRFVGLISYSLYLWHLPLIEGIVGGHASGWAGWQRLLLGAGVVLFAALPLAYLSYTFVERPFLARRYRAPAPVSRTEPARPDERVAPVARR
ncbi:MAG: acyltransferase family protein [Ktedonobacterales bacterium]